MLSLVGASVFATGGKKEAPKPSGSSPKTLIEKVKDAVPLNASSRCVAYAGIVTSHSGSDSRIFYSEEEQLYVTFSSSP